MKRLIELWKCRRFMAREYEDLPEGWLSKFQARTLYLHALRHPGPILEIGPWIGRSTCCLAAGIRDSGKQKPFTTVDLGISSREDWKAFFGRDLETKPNKDRYLKHVERPGGPIESLKENLAARGLDQLVEVIRGDFREIDFSTRFQLIFCDATHSVQEVEQNGPHLDRLLLPGGTLIADDVRNHDILTALLKALAFGEHALKEQLFTGVKAA